MVRVGGGGGGGGGAGLFKVRYYHCHPSTKRFMANYFTCQTYERVQTDTENVLKQAAVKNEINI